MTELTRRDLVRHAGLAMGGLLALEALSGCGDESIPTPPQADPETPTPPATDPATPDPVPPAQTAPGPQAKDWPYEKHLPAGYRLDAAAVREAAYHGYYAGGCCHGAYRGLLEHLATTAGAPFDQLPLDFGRFGGGGIASYGSICGAALGGVLVVNMIVADGTARNALMTDLLRWYEGFAFPQYDPAGVDAAETGLTKSFAAGNLPNLQRKPGSHLCHASVSGWCAAIGVSAAGADKKARCARLTADVAGHVAEMLNAYLASHTYKAGAMDAVTSGCVTCHTGATSEPPSVASGMSCNTCHTGQMSGHP